MEQLEHLLFMLKHPLSKRVSVIMTDTAEKTDGISRMLHFLVKLGYEDSGKRFLTKLWF
jgi:hypothetical protein